MLQYNQASYLWAKKVLLPEIQRAEEHGCVFSVPDVLNLVAKLLLEQFNEIITWHYTKSYAFAVMSSFQTQLDTIGYYEFGEDDMMRLVPSKYRGG